MVMPGLLEGSWGKGMNLGGWSGVSLQPERTSHTLTHFTVSFWVGNVCHPTSTESQSNHTLLSVCLSPSCLYVVKWVSPGGGICKGLAYFKWLRPMDVGMFK